MNQDLVIPQIHQDNSDQPVRKPLISTAIY